VVLLLLATKLPNSSHFVTSVSAMRTSLSSESTTLGAGVGVLLVALIFILLWFCLTTLAQEVATEVATPEVAAQEVATEVATQEVAQEVAASEVAGEPLYAPKGVVANVFVFGIGVE